MIGNPITGNNSVAFNDLRVTTPTGPCSSSTGCTMTEANPSGANVVNDLFFHHNADGYVPRVPGSDLSTWEGNWVPELPEGAFNLPRIQFPLR